MRRSHVPSPSASVNLYNALDRYGPVSYHSRHQNTTFSQAVVIYRRVPPIICRKNDVLDCGQQNLIGALGLASQTDPPQGQSEHELVLPDHGKEASVIVVGGFNWGRARVILHFLMGVDVKQLS